VCGEVLPAIQHSKNHAYYIPRKMVKMFFRADYIFRIERLAETRASGAPTSSSAHRKYNLEERRIRARCQRGRWRSDLISELIRPQQSNPHDQLTPLCECITPEMSLKLGKFFKQSARFWFNIQTTCDFRQLLKKEKQITAAVTKDYTELAA
jgi:hypothetical protein